jgi:hypothetical protein
MVCSVPWNDARLTLWSILPVESSDSDVPLAAQLKSRSGDKGKNKARADRLDFTDVEASRDDAAFGRVTELV